MRAPRDACPGAQTCCASPTRTPARLANSRRTWSRRRTRKSTCVPSRWKVLSGEFRRRPTALAIKFRQSDRVGRRGLFEPGGIFSRLLTDAWTQTWFVQIFGSGLICRRAQTCCALKSSAPAGARQDNYADLLGLQTRRGSNHSAAYVGESNSRSNVFQIRRASVCVPSRWNVLSGEFRRRPTALAKDFRKLDRVGRRGLSEPREDFSRRLTDAFPYMHP